ncbi:related to DNA-directed RNA polymerase I/III chain AC19 [Cephalotrichum gorgonifer]|uniref:Related to DNA-directed RNA polymerase I/III chain AC19 n=1 Tax=Cephalotrichum gorgonifer TaxID=2041049 RepID=A0AAE8SVJ6_9PEZI|nr:related to DNA-directed RNA polymerase I/III chain AC19 [Cephalotrichum gorgonifer]
MPGTVDDTVMEDVSQAGGSERQGSEEAEEAGSRVTILPGSVDTAASFHPDVEFCAYTIPHPSEDKMNVRIQTYEGSAVDALQKGLQDLAAVCDVITDEFEQKISASRS